MSRIALILCTIWLVGSLEGLSAQNQKSNNKTYSDTELARIMINKGFTHFFGRDGKGAPHKTPLERLGKTMEANRDKLPSFIASAFGPARDKLLEAYKKKGRTIVLDPDIPASDFLAAAFSNKNNIPKYKGKEDITIYVHRTPEFDAEMKKRLGNSLFTDIYGQARRAEDADIFSLLLSGKPLQLPNDKEVYVVIEHSRFREVLTYENLDMVPADVLASAKEVHVSITQFHALDAKLTGTTAATTGSSIWMDLISSIYKSSENGKIIALGTGSNSKAIDDVLKLLNIDSCPVPA